MRIRAVSIAGAIAAAALCLGGAPACIADGQRGGPVPDAGVPSLVGDFQACVNLECREAACDGGETTLTGTVVAPRRDDPDPIYDALVYVPNAPVAPFADGATCDKCGAPISGAPIAMAHTGPDGKFVLRGVPAGADVPLVIQVGRWRRQVKVPFVKACETTKLPTELTRLPRNHHEGDIPLHAVATGSADALECVLRKMGVEDEEFTTPDGGGRVHVYTSNGAYVKGSPSADVLWSDGSKLLQYDVVLLDCEGAQLDKTPEAQARLAAYTAAGGRVFASHYSYTWLYDAPSFSAAAAWSVDLPNPGEPMLATIDRSFPKGQALATWMTFIGADTDGYVTLQAPRHDAMGVNAPAHRWIYSDEPQTLQQFTFNAPLDVPAEQQCGRVAFSDFHVTNTELSTTQYEFPIECGSGPMSPEEKVLEFMMFDLASCIENDTPPPEPIK